MPRTFLLAALVASAAAFQAPASPMLRSKVAVSKVAPIMAAPVDEPTDKAVAIGAAAVGGVLGVYLFHELSTAVFLSIALAYGTTVGNSFGNFSKSAGTTASKVYKKTLEINDEYDVLPKAKSALDVVTTAAGNLDANYGFSAKVDDSLKLSEAATKLGDKFDEIKNSVTSKVDDLKKK